MTDVCPRMDKVYPAKHEFMQSSMAASINCCKQERLQPLLSAVMNGCKHEWLQA